jgi:hypothetical protein
MAVGPVSGSNNNAESAFGVDLTSTASSSTASAGSDATGILQDAQQSNEQSEQDQLLAVLEKARDKDMTNAMSAFS